MPIDKKNIMDVYDYLYSLEDVTSDKKNLIDRYDTSFDESKKLFINYMNLINNSNDKNLTFIIDKVISLIKLDLCTTTGQIYELKDRFNNIIFNIYYRINLSYRLHNNIPTEFNKFKLDTIISASEFKKYLSDLYVKRKKYIKERINEIINKTFDKIDINDGLFIYSNNLFNLIVDNSDNKNDDEIFKNLQQLLEQYNNTMQKELNNLRENLSNKLSMAKSSQKNYDSILINTYISIISQALSMKEIDYNNNLDINILNNFTFTDRNNDKLIIESLLKYINNIYICFSSVDNDICFLIKDYIEQEYYLISNDDVINVDIEKVRQEYNIMLLDDFIDKSNQVNITKKLNDKVENIICQFEDIELYSIVSNNKVKYYLRNKSDIKSYNSNKLFLVNKIKGDILNKYNDSKSITLKEILHKF